MPSLGRRIKEATDLEAMGQFIEELFDLQRVAAEGTNAAVFFVQLQEIKVLLTLASRRPRELVAAELERAGYEVNLVGPQ
jgi:hypothetical protein